MDYTKTRFVGLHLVFWVGVWFFFIYFFSYNTTNSAYVIWFSSFLLPVTMLTTYFTVYVLLPKYLLVKKYGLFILYGLYTIVLSTYLILLSIFGSFMFLSNLKITQVPPMSRNFVFVLLLVFLVVSAVSFVRLLTHNFQTISRNKELENKLLEGQLKFKEQELQYLKKQIHPHFLFNTLNTIYGFSLKQSKQTPEVILKLSNLLDYILYQVQKPKVPLQEEVLHIKEYISLEKIRFQDTLKISFVMDEINENLQVAPMLFIPFVENAFKHGSIIDGFLTIEIVIKMKGTELEFTMKNSNKQDMDSPASKGVGLDNITKRLNLLYKENYELKVVQENSWHKVFLLIKDIHG